MRFLTLFICIGLCFAFVGCDFDSDDDSNDDERYTAERTNHYEWNADQVAALAVDNMNGTIIVNCVDTDSIKASITRRCEADEQSQADEGVLEIQIGMELTANVLTLTGTVPDGEDGVNYEVDFTIEMPADRLLTIDQINGIIDVDDHGQSVTIRQTNGTVSYDHTPVAFPNSIVINIVNGIVDLFLPDTASRTFALSTEVGVVSVTGFPDVTYEVNTMSYKAGTLGEGIGVAEINATNGTLTMHGISN